AGEGEERESAGFGDGGGEADVLEVPLVAAGGVGVAGVVGIEEDADLVADGGVGGGEDGGGGGNVGEMAEDAVVTAGEGIGSVVEQGVGGDGVAAGEGGGVVVPDEAFGDEFV